MPIISVKDNENIKWKRNKPPHPLPPPPPPTPNPPPQKKKKRTSGTWIILKKRELYEWKHVEVSVDVWKYETCYPFWYVPQS